MLQAATGRRADQDKNPVSQLTNREFEIFQLFGEGLDGNAVAEFFRPRLTRIRVLHVAAFSTHRI